MPNSVEGLLHYYYYYHYYDILRSGRHPYGNDKRSHIIII